MLAKLATVDFGHVALSTTTMTSLLLSVFAIGLSAAFYFRAEKVSTEHYTRTYEFTERVAEVLSRLEVGVVGQLTQLTRAQASLEQALRSPNAVRARGTTTERDDTPGMARAVAATEFGPATQLEERDGEVASFAAKLGELEEAYSRSHDGARVTGPVFGELVGTSEALPVSFVGELWREVIPAVLI